MRTAGALASRVDGRLRRGPLGPVIDGFIEHAWTGRLYLISTGAGLLVSMGIFLSMLVSGTLTSGRLSGLFGSILTFAAFGTPIFYFQWRLLRGIACFSARARRWAMVFTAVGVLSGLGSFATGLGFKGMLVAAAEVALSAQFFIYFLRNGDRFTSAFPGTDEHSALDGDAAAPRPSTLRASAGP